MPRTSNIFARVEPKVKEQAEIVLDQLGIPMSNAIGMFLRQIIIHRGIPFEMKLPSKKPFVISEHSKEKLSNMVKRIVEEGVLRKGDGGAPVNLG